MFLQWAVCVALRLKGPERIDERKRRRAAERVADELAEPMFSPKSDDQF